MLHSVVGGEGKNQYFDYLRLRFLMWTEPVGSITESIPPLSIPRSASLAAETIPVSFQPRGRHSAGSAGMESIYTGIDSIVADSPVRFHHLCSEIGEIDSEIVSCPVLFRDLSSLLICVKAMDVQDRATHLW